MKTYTFGKSIVIHNSRAFREALEFANSEYPLLPILDKHIDKEVWIVQQHFLAELHPLLSPNSSLPRLFCPKPYIQIILTPDTSHQKLALNPKESM